jgi:DNA modification methylase
MSRIEHIAEGVTLYLGDCLDVFPLLSDVDAVVTDPPYGVGVKYGEAYDDRRSDYWDWLRARIDASRKLAPLVVFTHRVAALREFKDWDWTAVWNKPGAFGSRLGNSCVLPHWEPIFLYGIHATGVNSKYASDVVTFNPEPAKAGIKGVGREKWAGEFYSHPCPKPVGLYQQFLSTYAQNAKTICDPFMGSGTTGVAAVSMGRRFIGIEIEEKHFDACCRRIEGAISQGDMFVEKPKPMKQTALFDAVND